MFKICVSYLHSLINHHSVKMQNFLSNSTITADLPPRTLKPYLEFFIWIDLIGSLFSHNIQVVFLQESKVFSCLRKLSFLHTFTHIPMHKSSLGIHQVVLRVDPFGEHTADSNVVPNHSYILFSGGRDIFLNNSSWNFIQTYLETCGTPLDEADLVVLLEPLYGCICLFRLDVTTVVNRDCHILVLHRVKLGVLDKHVLWLEAVVSDFSHHLCLMRCLLLANNRCKRCSHEVQPRKWYQVRLELAQINVQFSVETQRSCHGGYNLGNQHVKISITRSINVKLFLAYMVNCLVVKDNRNFCVIQKPMGCKHRVVRLNNASGDLRRRIDFISYL